MKRQKRTLLPETGGAITNRIKWIMKERGLNISGLARTCDIDDANLSRMLKQKERTWTLDTLEKIAIGLNLSLCNIVCEPFMIPVVAEITSEGIPHHQLFDHPPMDYRQSFSEDDLVTLAKQYCLKVEGRSLLPYFPPCSILIVQKDSAESIKSEDFVVYTDGRGITQVRQVILGDNHLVLRSLDPRNHDLFLPAQHIKLCDRIIRIEFSR